MGSTSLTEPLLFDYAILHRVIEGFETPFLFYAYNLVVPESAGKGISRYHPCSRGRLYQTLEELGGGACL